MLRIKLNLSPGRYLTRIDPEYIRPGKEGNECGATCPSFPYYRCTRDKGHDSNPAIDSDHAAHGFVTTRRVIAMFARWSDRDNNKDKNGETV